MKAVNMDNLFKTGIRPIVDEHLAKLAAEKRDYGAFWSASSAGYCQRKLIFERLNIPYTSEDARKQRVFSAGNIFHEWIQGITKAASISIAQELELQDEDLMVRGHIDDIVLINDKPILYDYKSAHSRSFTYAKDRPMSHYHKMQLGTYMYMLRKREKPYSATPLEEGRILSISKDDLRQSEKQLLWSAGLEKEVVGYWRTLNGYWKKFNTDGKTLPKCTCADYENGFLARPNYNPYYYEGHPCSLVWFRLKMAEAKQ